MRFAVIDNCPVPAALHAELVEIKRRSGCTFQSIDRSPAAEPLLKRLGKMSQRQLFDGFRRGLPGFNPANPPGRSTHERRNDGVAYRGPAGMFLRYWQVGMDVDIEHVDDFIRAAKELGFTATVTYPGNSRELQHVNFRREPRLKIFRALKRGQTSRRVKTLRWALGFVLDPDSRETYLPRRSKQKARNPHFFDEELERALMRYQRDHGQKADGVYGLQTRRQLAASVRFRRQRLKQKKRK